METLGGSYLLEVESLGTKSSALRHGPLPSVSYTRGSRAESSPDQISPAIATLFHTSSLPSPGKREDLGWTKISKDLSTKNIVVFDTYNERKNLSFFKMKQKLNAYNRNFFLDFSRNIQRS